MRPTHRCRLALAAVAAATTACATVDAGRGEPAATDPTPPTSAFDAAVVRVVDGDTFIARKAGESRTQRVRVIGVDAPESVAPDQPVECYGPQASAATKQLLPKGIRIRVATEPGGDRDRFGRLLWDVWLPDGRFLQAVLVEQGAARAYPIRPQTTYADLLASREAQARDQRRGLWGACGR